MNSEEIQENLKRHVFYHGTSAEALKRIIQEGFKVWQTFEDGERFPSSGCLGNGIYMTCNWRMALFFGNVLMQVTLRPGTRILDASKEPDPAVLSYLQREFGREVLTQSSWKSLPRNKQLTLEELICLFRYHYRRSWVMPERDSRSERFLDGSKKRGKHCELLDSFRKVLIRYGFHGYGHPEDDVGLVIFAEDRVVLRDLVAQVPFNRWLEIYDKAKSYGSVEQLRRLFGKDRMDAVDWPKKT